MVACACGRYFLRQYKHLELKEPQTDTSAASAPGKLTPIRNAENIGLYETELSDKLDDPDVKNIAITGPYGSGKSSIIKTFLYRHPEYRPLYVSLAAFKDDRTINGKMGDSANMETEEDAISPEQQKVLDDRIEYSILQQLFYHVKGKDVPFSRLKRIRTVKPSKIVRLALLVSLFVICVLYLYKPSWLPGYNAWVIHVPGWLDFVAILGMVVGAVYLIYLLFKFQQNASMIKLNLDKAQLEIAPDKGSSVLNQHMDEIVYYFSATSHDLLVIEDLDRFKNPEIFVKLREINTLINNSLQINRKVTFIYALRDDVFFDTNRTKFFDFILPVVPVTNASNSASKYRLAIQDIEKYNEGQFTGLSAAGHESITQYILANLDTYINQVFIQLPAHDEESQDTFLFLFKNKKLSDATKTAIIEKASFLIEDLEAIPVAYIELLFQKHYQKAV